MNRRNFRNIILGTLVVAALAAGALMTGVLRQADDPRALFAQAEQNAQSCVRDSGHDYPKAGGVSLGEAQSGSKRLAAYNECWTRVANDTQYASLKIPTPAARLSRARADGFRHWHCVEEAGFRRTRPIAMNGPGPGGYPLLPAAGHFAVAGDQASLGAFYKAVARCGNMRIEDLQRPDGKFADATADGAKCERHEHSGDRHSHGCYSVDAYPEGL